MRKRSKNNSIYCSPTKRAEHILARISPTRYIYILHKTEFKKINKKNGRPWNTFQRQRFALLCRCRCFKSILFLLLLLLLLHLLFVTVLRPPRVGFSTLANRYDTIVFLLLFIFSRFTVGSRFIAVRVQEMKNLYAPSI